MMIQMLYAAFLSLSIIGIPTVSAQASPIVRITSVAAPPPDTKCVNAQGINPGAPVAIFDCNDSPTEQWQLIQTTSLIQLAGTNFCLDAGTTTGPSNQLAIFACNPGSPLQQWKYDTNLKEISPVFNSNLCLDVAGSELANGNALQTAPCNGNQDQRWLLVVS